MTLDEAINHAEEVAEENRNVDEEELGLIYCDDTECIENHKKRCFKCADEHEQLAEWLRDYKRLLEQQPCEDCVSRKQALIGIRNLYPGIPFTRQNVKKWKEENKKYFECENVIRDLPSVAPKTNWIPVSERLPEDYQRVLITVVRYDGEKNVRVAKYRNKFKTFDCLENHEQWEVGEEGLLAWRPLPEPYQEE